MKATYFTQLCQLVLSFLFLPQIVKGGESYVLADTGFEDKEDSVPIGESVYT